MQDLKELIDKAAHDGALITRDEMDGILMRDLARVRGICALIMSNKTVRVAVVDELYNGYLTKVDNNLTPEQKESLKAFNQETNG